MAVLTIFMQQKTKLQAFFAASLNSSGLILGSLLFTTEKYKKVGS